MTHSTEQEIAAAWNAQADELNQWDELDLQEKIEWAAKFGKNQAARRAQVGAAPRKDEQSVFEGWLERVCPSGDVSEVQRKWEVSSDYLDWLAAAPLAAGVQP